MYQKYITFIFIGNEAGHFTFNNDTADSRDDTSTLSPPVYELTYVTGTNISYVGMEHLSMFLIINVQRYTIYTKLQLHVKAR